MPVHLTEKCRETSQCSEERGTGLKGRPASTWLPRCRREPRVGGAQPWGSAEPSRGVAVSEQNCQNKTTNTTQRGRDGEDMADEKRVGSSVVKVHTNLCMQQYDKQDVQPNKAIAKKISAGFSHVSAELLMFENEVWIP